ncbi:somatostatin receptor type 5-like [Stylophora pistillata]|uniref:somatostatin receptor type 5-like n=1 Tax=Stylophora pistillata TaxID=50429 RepID=UPI000C03E7D0|nr:somatostatin receptor type 5-like [Stylophora pistillata]
MKLIINFSKYSRIIKLKNRLKVPQTLASEATSIFMETNYPEVCILVVLYAIVVLTGLPGNILFIVVVKRTRSMHTTTNFILANIAVADAITLLFCFPGVLMQFVVDHHPGNSFGSFLCKFVTMHQIAGVTLLVSGLSLTLISIARHNALLRPMDAKLRLRKKQLHLAVSLIWLFSIAFVLPLFVEQKYVDEVESCHMDWKAPVSKAYWGFLAGLTLLSWVVMFVCYFRIVKGILCGSIFSSSSNQCENVKQKDIQRKKKIVKLLITITILFIVCFLPFALVSAMKVSSRSLFYKVSYFIVYCSCSLNPVVYAFQSSNYRTGIRYLCDERRSRYIMNSGNDVL